MRRHLSMFAAWGLSFGFAVGWGAFVMPGAEFLPNAGPLGTVIGILVGALAMAVIGWNYYRMVSDLPGPGGAYAYAKKAFGADYGYLTAWSLTLAYMAILWANATALILLVRHIFGDVLQFGWHDTLAGFDIYLGEVLLSVLVMIAAGVVCLLHRRLAGRVQGFLALFMLVGVSVCFFFAVSRHEGGFASMAPAYSSGSTPFRQVLRILAMMPWAFVGFEAISHSSGEFGFPRKRLWRVIVAAIAASVAMYVMLTLLPVLLHPGEVSGWAEYLNVRSGLDGLDSMPTFAAARKAMGNAGVALLGVTMFAAIFTGIVGATIAMSRLIYALAADGLFTKFTWLGDLDGSGLPRNAVLFVVGISLVIPFFGRTVIGWPVEVSSIGAAVAYCCTSAAAYKSARKEGRFFSKAAGIAGMAMSVVFCLLLLVPNFISSSALSAESYLVLALWCIAGFALYLHVFRNDVRQRFGRSPVVWTGIVILIFFSSLMWVRLSAQRATAKTVHAIVDYSAQHCAKHHGGANEKLLHAEEGFITDQIDDLDTSRLRYDIIQMGLLTISLVIMFTLYAIQRRREEQLEVAHAKAEARDRAKSAFLSSISHDIRTPMNAILGYIELAKRKGVSEDALKHYIANMESSSHHLLALITDVLEMSRIESGKVDLEPVPIDLAATMHELETLFSLQMSEKKITFRIDFSHVVHRHVMCDRSRLNRVLLNLVGNALKFTPSGGAITVSLSEDLSANDGEGIYVLRVKDTGVGMSREFIKHVFDPFERERTSVQNGVAGTGLGMAIAKGIVDLMKGSVSVESVKGKGTEFVVQLPLKFTSATVYDDPGEDGDGSPDGKPEVDFTKTRMLLVEDNEINREIAREMLSQSGIAVEEAENGQVAVETVARKGLAHFDAILMDVHMPVMDGYTATRLIRAMEMPGASRIPIIALSANAFETDVKDALAAGMDAHIAKPIKVQLLFRTLKRLIRVRAPGESAPKLLPVLAKMGCDVETALREVYLGDAGFYEKMLGRLLGNTMLAQVRVAFDRHAVAELFEASHSLKGQYASLGLTPLHALCGEIVEIARAGGFDGVEKRLERLEKLHEEVLSVIRDSQTKEAT